MWRITKDFIAEAGEPTRVGYSEEHERIPVIAVAAGFQSQPLATEYPLVEFRLRDEDDEVHYEGELHDDPECDNQLAALRFGEADTGACIIEVKRDGQWVMEIG
jgi:hypothetical protein